MTARVWRWGAAAAVAGALASGAPGAGADGRQGAVATPEAVRAAIADLGRLDYNVRMRAARTIRRAPPEVAVPALYDAVAHHPDGYVRYRALVLVTGFRDPRTREVMIEALADRNDRLRAVAYRFFEHQPDPAVTPRLLAALDTEQSEFVRPALTRAVTAAATSDADARAAVLPLIGRGEDFFRAAVIEALGDHRIEAAVSALEPVVRLDGPLQDDAVLTLGKIGDRRALLALAETRRTAPRELQPSLAAAFCLLGAACEAEERFLVDTLRFGAAQAGYQPLVRATAAALVALGVAGRATALGALFDVGVASQDPARAPLALAVGTVALRHTPLVLTDLEGRADRDAAVELLRDGFDMLEEDFEKERFFAAVRRAYWEAPESSVRRRLCETLIARLDF